MRNFAALGLALEHGVTRLNSRSTIDILVWAELTLRGTARHIGALRGADAFDLKQEGAGAKAGSSARRVGDRQALPRGSVESAERPFDPRQRHAHVGGVLIYST